eukprot:Rmarinus@m.25854
MDRGPPYRLVTAATGLRCPCTRREARAVQSNQSSGNLAGLPRTLGSAAVSLRAARGGRATVLRRHQLALSRDERRRLKRRPRHMRRQLPLPSNNLKPMHSRRTGLMRSRRMGPRHIHSSTRTLHHKARTNLNSLVRPLVLVVARQLG